MEQNGQKCYRPSYRVWLNEQSLRTLPLYRLKTQFMENNGKKVPVTGRTPSCYETDSGMQIRKRTEQVKIKKVTAFQPVPEQQAHLSAMWFIQIKILHSSSQTVQKLQCLLNLPLRPMIKRSQR